MALPCASSRRARPIHRTHISRPRPAGSAARRCSANSGGGSDPSNTRAGSSPARACIVRAIQEARSMARASSKGRARRSRARRARSVHLGWSPISHASLGRPGSMTRRPRSYGPSAATLMSVHQPPLGTPHCADTSEIRGELESRGTLPARATHGAHARARSGIVEELPAATAKQATREDGPAGRTLRAPRRAATAATTAALARHRLEHRVGKARRCSSAAPRGIAISPDRVLSRRAPHVTTHERSSAAAPGIW